MAFGLGILLIAVLPGPALIKPVEQNIEIFFLVAGAFASAITGQWGKRLFVAALTEPIALTIAVLVFGVAARLARPSLDRMIERLVKVVAPRWIYFGLIIALGLLSRLTHKIESGDSKGIAAPVLVNSR